MRHPYPLDPPEISPEESAIEELWQRLLVLEGQNRAHQALFIEMAVKEPALVEAAMERVRKQARWRDGHWSKLKDAFGLPSDEQAERALHGIIQEAKSDKP
jgi:hypothetical protein